MSIRSRFKLFNKIILSSYAPVGGQAVIEGVMMRSPTSVATAVARASGDITVDTAPFLSITRRFKILGLPLVRGVVGLVETLILGMKSLSYSASEVAKDEEMKEGKSSDDAKGISNWSMGLTMALSFALGLLVFFYLPLRLTDWMGFEGRIAFNAVDGLIRMTFFLAYLWGISQWGEMRRLFQFHGAEHKVIHTFEAGEELIPENAKRFTTLHPRCGTSFLFSIMVLSVVVFIFFGRPDTLGDRLLRFAGVPLIGGLGFEYIRFSGRHSGNSVVRWLAQPGLWLQRITTKEPDLDQLAVACRALDSVLPLSAEDLRGVRVM